MIILTDKAIQEIKLKPYCVRLYMTEDSLPMCYVTLATSEQHAEALVIINETRIKGKDYYQVIADRWDGEFYNFLG